MTFSELQQTKEYQNILGIAEDDEDLDNRVADELYHVLDESDDDFENSKDSSFTQQNTSTINDTTKKKRKRKNKKKNNFPKEVNPF
jgi:hypothetical protein